jgi:hypothetical protein
MSIHTKEILRAYKETNVQLDQLEKDQQEKFWNFFKEKFKLSLDGQLWCQINFEYNKYDPDGWKSAGDFFEEWPVFFFCDAYLHTPIFRIHSKNDLNSILEESFHFVFYLANNDLSKLVVFDDHECLRAKGFEISNPKTMLV